MRKGYELLGSLFGIGIYVRVGASIFDKTFKEYLSCDKNFIATKNKRKKITKTKL